ncbi:MAG: ATP-binding protein [Bacteroidota bacterium]|nr:ATP-binding protein [Bacteroidota bacterium]MDP3432274.1 ATP-binding protein [Bacteroidota bacterium]
MERSLVISSHLTNIKEVRIFLEKVYHEFSLSRNSFNHVFLGISEAVNNAILHGNKLDTEKKVSIKLNLFDNQLHIEIEDEGDGFCDTLLFDPTLPENIKCESGRGIYIIRQIADELVFKEEGRKVYMLFTIS